MGEATRLTERSRERDDRLVVGRVIDVGDHPGARGPSFLVHVDIGSEGEIEAQMEPGSYAKDDLPGTLVVVTVGDGAIVLAARSHAHGAVLVRPDLEVEAGTPVA
jgi:tRNA-binding EMAP/Myf-like protein